MRPARRRSRGERESPPCGGIIQRPGTGADIAHLAVYLASDESSWVTGQNIGVDGGATAGWRDDAESDRIAALYA